MTSIKLPTCRECSELYINNNLAKCGASLGEDIQVSLHKLPHNCPRLEEKTQALRNAMINGSPILQAKKEEARRSLDGRYLEDDPRYTSRCDDCSRYSQRRTDPCLEVIREDYERRGARGQVISRPPPPPVFTRPPKPQWRVSPEDFSAPIPKPKASARDD